METCFHVGLIVKCKNGTEIPGNPAEKERGERSDCELFRLSYMLGLGCNWRPKEQENEKHISNVIIRNSCCCPVIRLSSRIALPEFAIGCGLWLGTSASMCNTLALRVFMFSVLERSHVPLSNNRIVPWDYLRLSKRKKESSLFYVCMSMANVRIDKKINKNWHRTRIQM